MFSYFEQMFKQMFMKKYSCGAAKGSTKRYKCNITEEYRMILDKVAIGLIYDSFENEKVIKAMMKLTRTQRIVLSFHIIAELDMREIAYLLDTDIHNTYPLKSKALKRLKAELDNI